MLLSDSWLVVLLETSVQQFYPQSDPSCVLQSGAEQITTVNLIQEEYDCVGHQIPLHLVK